MPKGGHNAVPTKLKVLRGTDRPDRVNENEPMPRPVAGKMPAGLEYYAKKAWKEFAPKLERLGLLTELDTEMFALWCEAYARKQRAKKRLAKVDRDDQQAIRPIEISIENASKEMRMLSTEFGMSAVARTRLSVESESEEDAFAAFLDGHVK